MIIYIFIEIIKRVEYSGKRSYLIIKIESIITSKGKNRTNIRSFNSSKKRSVL